MRRPLIGTLAAAAVFAVLALTPAAPPVAVAATTQPNVVVILTDDQHVGTLSPMPTVRSQIVARGTSYANAMVPTSLCCPSRASLLTGSYSHTTRVWANHGTAGGWTAFKNNGNESRTIAVALRNAGYTTGLVGKYLNGYELKAPANYVPPGWDTFVTFDEISPVAGTTDHSGAYYQYSLTFSDVFHGTAAADYSTDVLADEAVRFIRNAPATKPLFLMFTPYGPHEPYTPAPRDVGAWPLSTSYRNAAFNEADVSDKPAYIRTKPLLSASAIDSEVQLQNEAVMSIDDATSRILAELGTRLPNTLVVFASDNGMLWGMHRLDGKGTPHDMATRVPMAMRWDGHVAAGATDNRLALNVDVTATIAAAAGVSPLSKAAGFSLLTTKSRAGFVLEGVELHASNNLVQPYCGWRTKRYMYARYSTGEEELYDYTTDPYELTNLAKVASSASTLAGLKAKAKAACAPTPPGFRW